MSGLPETPDGYLVLDAAARFLEVSPAYLPMFAALYHVAVIRRNGKVYCNVADLALAKSARQKVMQPNVREAESTERGIK